MSSDRSASPNGMLNGQAGAEVGPGNLAHADAAASPAAQELLGTEASIFPLPPKSLYGPFADYAEETKDQPEFQPPRVDWIHEDGHWQVFGQSWPIEDHLPSLQEIGIDPIHDVGADRRDALRMLLRTLLHAHFSLLDTLAKPPPSIHRPMDQPNDLDKILSHIKITTFSMHHMVNQLRPIQAKENLIKLAQDEISQTRGRTQQLQNKVQEVRESLQLLQKYKRPQGGDHAMDLDPAASASAPVLDEKTRRRNKLMSAIDDIS